MEPQDRLGFSNFFTDFYIIDTESEKLSKGDQTKALAYSILLGFATLGLVHLVCAITKYCIKPIDKDDDPDAEKTDSVGREAMYKGPEDNAITAGAQAGKGSTVLPTPETREREGIDLPPEPPKIGSPGVEPPKVNSTSGTETMKTEKKVEVAHARANQGIADGINELHVKLILAFDVAPKVPPWTGADLYNNSNLQLFWNQFENSWAKDVNINYNDPLPPIAEANLDDLMTISTYEVRSLRHQLDPDDCIADIANSGKLLAWQSRLREVWAAR